MSRKHDTSAPPAGGSTPMQAAMDWTSGAAPPAPEEAAPVPPRGAQASRNGGARAATPATARQAALVPQAPLQAPRPGLAVTRSDAPGMASIQIVRPRDRHDVLAEALEEAAAIGEDFWYAWDVKGERASGHVEGISITGANALLRAWGNCAAWVEVEAEDDATWSMRATFVDAESGIAVSRVFRQAKGAGKLGRIDPERVLDMQFAKGQSKAIRNIVLHALPESVKRKALAEAKRAAMQDQAGADLPSLRVRSIKAFRALGVDQPRLEAKIGLAADRWGAEDVAQLRALYRAITQEGVPLSEVFPPSEAPRATVDLSSARLATPKPKAEAPAAPKEPNCPTCGLQHAEGACKVREPGEEG